MVKAIKMESQKMYAIITVYMISFVAVLNLINSLLNMVGLQTVLDTVVLYGILFGLLLVGLLMVVSDHRGMEIDVFVAVGVFILLYVLSYVLHPENRRYLATSLLDYAGNPLYLIFLYSLPCYVFVRKLKDYVYFQKLLVICSYVIVAMSIVVFLFGGDVHGRQYMTFSYNMLLQLLVLIYHKPKNLRWLHNIFLVLSTIIFAIGGARGALIAFVAVIVLYNFMTLHMNRKTILRLMLMIMVVVLFLMFKDRIIMYLINILKRVSIESRTLEYIVNGQFLEDSYRITVYTFSWGQIDIFGYGMRGDRAILNGSYVHNIFIELWMDFGWIFGTLIIALLLVVLFFGIKNKNKPEHFYVFLFLSIGFFSLLLSGSYLNQTPAFFALFGFCANAIIRRESQQCDPQS